MTTTETDAAPTGPDAPRRALLADGAAVILRRLGPGDGDAVRALHEGLRRDDRRWSHAAPAASDGRIDEVVLAPGAVAYGAVEGERLIGVAQYGPPRRPGAEPGIAVAVAPDARRRGVASLLLERLLSAAYARGVHRLAADVRAADHEMIRVVRDSGLPFSALPDGEVRHLVLHVPDLAAPTARTERYLGALTEREARADVASLRPVLAPRAVAVVGAGHRRGSVGRLVLERIVTGGFRGGVHVVHPRAAAVAGVPAVARVADLPGDVDLAVLCVPAAAVPDVAEQCGRAGIRALLVVTAGVSTDPAVAAGLAAAAARHGMRVVGPNCLGLANTDPAVSLQASFGPPVAPGPVGVAAQSGGVAIALAAGLEHVGLGVSTTVSTGDAPDVNVDDLLLWWAADGRTRAAVLYLESVRRPRRFARLARRLARRMPVVAVRSGSSRAGRQAAASHTAGSATPRTVRDALLAQAGVLAVDDPGEAAGLLAMLVGQGAPAGRRVAVLSNAGGAGVLAADACDRYGLPVAALAPATRGALRALLPATASVADPVDATATVPPDVFGAAVAALRADPGVDAVLVLTVATGAGDPLDGVAAAFAEAVAAGAAVPVVAVRLGQAAGVTALPGAAGVPVFADPGPAARALALAADRGAWLARSDAPARVPRGADPDRATALAAAALRENPGGGWLDPERTAALLASAGVRQAPATVVRTAEAAVRRWRALGGPVAAKADVDGVLHKSAAGAVRTGLDSRRAVRAAVAGFRARFGTRLRGVLVQPMVAGSPELLAGVTGDPLFGPLLTVGLGGTTTDLADDRAHCLVPATAADLDALPDGLRAAPRLFAGPDGARVRTALRDVAGRLAWLAGHVAEIAEAEVNPLVVTADGPVALDARVRLAPVEPDDPWARVLPA